MDTQMEIQREIGVAQRIGSSINGITASTLAAGAPDEFRRSWPVVAACFCTAVFAWGFGFYGQAVYLAELQRLHGWPAGLVSGATTCFYLTGACLMPLVHRAIRRAGPRIVLAGGIVLLAAGAVALSQVSTSWQMFACTLPMAAGWAGSSTVAIATTLSLWFDQRRGLAISLALNGASAAGFTIAPLLVALSHAIGFTIAVPVVALAGLAVTLPVVLLAVHDQPTISSQVAQPGVAALPDARPAIVSQAQAMRDPRFWSISAPFALAVAAQVGFIVHQVAFLLPRLGASPTGVAVGCTAFAAMAGRLVLGAVVDQLNQRLTSAASFVSQATGLGLLLALPHRPEALYLGCVVFGFSVGNVITLPALLIQREFSPGSFGLVVGLSTAVGQFALALAPGLFGVLRDATGGYGPVLLACMALEIAAAVLVVTTRQPHGR
jgi:predicted MFS family arabinose efflux permease